MLEPQLAPISCRKKQELIASACGALERIRLRSEQAQRSWQRKPPTLDEIEQFAEEFDRSIRFHRSLLERYEAHVREHGCYERQPLPKPSARETGSAVSNQRAAGD